MLVIGLLSRTIGGMEQGWRPIAELMPGHYAVGRLDDGHEVDIYRAGAAVFNVATGTKIEQVVSWQTRAIKPDEK